MGFGWVGTNLVGVLVKVERRNSFDDSFPVVIVPVMD